MIKGIRKNNEIKYGGKLLDNKKLLAVFGAGVAVCAATIVTIDYFVRKTKAYEK